MQEVREIWRIHAHTLDSLCCASSPVFRQTPEVTATQTLELLASVSARTHVSDTEFVVESLSFNTTTTNTKPKSFNGVVQFFIKVKCLILMTQEHNRLKVKKQHIESS